MRSLCLSRLSIVALTHAGGGFNPSYALSSRIHYGHESVFIYRECKAQNKVKNSFRDGEAVISTLTVGEGGLYIEYPLSTYH